MLRELSEYGERHGLNVTPGLQSKSYDYVNRSQPMMADLSDVTKEERVFWCLPSFGATRACAGSSTKSQFLLDKLSTVT